MSEKRKGYIYTEEQIKQVFMNFDSMDRAIGREKYKIIASIIYILENPIQEIELNKPENEGTEI